MSAPNPYVWEAVCAPRVEIGHQDRGALVIQVRQMTKRNPDGRARVAVATVTALAGSNRKVHDNVLIFEGEPRAFAELFRRALRAPRKDWTVSLFDTE